MTQVLEVANVGEIAIRKLDSVPTFGDFAIKFIT